MVNDKKLKHIQWHLQGQRQRLHENVLLRKSILEANYARQVQVEKDAIRSSIARMRGRLRRVLGGRALGGAPAPRAPAACRHSSS